ncbi:hypothetical protein NDU88_008920 [Pleurodeles waltl]|uniref:Uncharacterized protein n=1 Tax=Pleurodeles waltl TaxID=8319 RepID=A0AAV7RUN4_PLEWA|nr:hypothetical protein NDU88_008920 [Pleurodeles waltl]
MSYELSWACAIELCLTLFKPQSELTPDLDVDCGFTGIIFTELYAPVRRGVCPPENGEFGVSATEPAAREDPGLNPQGHTDSSFRVQHPPELQ